MDSLKFYLVAALFAAYFLFQAFRSRRMRMKLPELLAQGAVVVDVRTREEFAGGARPGSLNIPLDELARSVEKLDRARPVIVCCASGARSAMAAVWLKKQGFDRVVNAGAWQNTLVEPASV
ncbi:MAG: rhodanese-like domain-containing protein [Oligoflexia bacterium]|nr:rhodanese-like domain-containing protein [Oligoflexia bacterium]